MADWVGVADRVGDVLDSRVRVGVGLPVAAALLVAVRVPDGGTLAVPLNKAVDVDVGDADDPELAAPAEAAEEGEKMGGIEEGPPVQAETDAEKRTVTVAQPAAVSLALLTFMRPPVIPGGRRL